MIPCDGCSVECEVGSLALIADYGHECRYCRECAQEYEQWQITTKAEETKRQKEFDLWQLEMRRYVPLKIMPLDFGPVVRRLGALPVVLG